MAVKSITCSISEKVTLDQDRGVSLMKPWIETGFTFFDPFGIGLK
jgi:hypothetical protein